MREPTTVERPGLSVSPGRETRVRVASLEGVMIEGEVSRSRLAECIVRQLPEARALVSEELSRWDEDEASLHSLGRSICDLLRQALQKSDFEFVERVAVLLESMIRSGRRMSGDVAAVAVFEALGEESLSALIPYLGPNGVDVVESQLGFEEKAQYIHGLWLERNLSAVRRRRLDLFEAH